MKHIFQAATFGQQLERRTFITSPRMLEFEERYSRPFSRQIPDASNLCGFLHRLAGAQIPPPPVYRRHCRTFEKSVGESAWFRKSAVNIEKQRGDAHLIALF